MRIDFCNDKTSEYDELESLFARLAEKTFNHLKIDTNYVVETRITGDELVREVNKAYRGLDKATDVLSFAFLEGDGEVPFENGETLLGEIIISLDTAIKEAKDNEVSLNWQLAFLFEHGLLHLLGYDHQKEDEALKMFALQEAMLEGEVK